MEMLQTYYGILWECYKGAIKGIFPYQAAAMKPVKTLQTCCRGAMEMLSKTLKMLPSRVPESKNFPAARPREMGIPVGRLILPPPAGQRGARCKDARDRPLVFPFPVYFYFFPFHC